MTSPLQADRVDQAPVRILCLSPHPPAAEALAVSVAAVAPQTEVDASGPIPAGEQVAADLVVVDATSDPAAAMATLLSLRARGAVTPAIVVLSTPDAYPREELRRVGDPVVVSLADLPTSLPNAIEQALRLNAATAASRQLVPLLRSLRESQRLIAAGRIARRVKHDINNPLAALLGEAQLLELEPLAPEQLEAVQRIVELCGRIVALARELDGPSPTSP